MNNTVIPKREIANTGLQVDELGFGCAPLGNLYQPVSDTEAADTLAAAWQLGFRHFDTAPHYGQGLSERRTGDALRHLQGRDYVLSSKVGRLLKPAGYRAERHGFVSPMPFDFSYDYSYDGVMRSYEDSIMRLGLDRIDILYIHDIGRMTHGDANDELFKTAMTGGYKALDELRSQGLVKAIGLGVNESEVCEAALEHGNWDCFLLAGRYTLLEQASLATLLPKCEQSNTSVVVGGPYNSGILATGVNNVSKPMYNYMSATPNIIEKVARIEATCQEFNVTLAAAALQFPLAHPSVVSVIPGLGSVRRIEQTIELFKQTIPSEFWQALQTQGLIDKAAPLPSAKVAE
ncbi:aldo/keto reductase [Gilvimarinus sp. 1_MG-2023]|uniref:aldo/keto reductase n=1 Tax=Gilvimarinus sp. 1_MG-2023 TaxID=3062638 RepID=UPI0026E48C41|nr:aldo/keto reductase [Gilvimarinus sp. 1_MG-2023]MDO6746724.1 aldo/keto reductase [Gilvimarinus sp. 1_MG-2023]